MYSWRGIIFGRGTGAYRSKHGRVAGESGMERGESQPGVAELLCSAIVTRQVGRRRRRMLQRGCTGAEESSGYFGLCNPPYLFFLFSFIKSNCLYRAVRWNLCYCWSVSPFFHWLFLSAAAARRSNSRRMPRRFAALSQAQLQKPTLFSQKNVN